ncbi:hypothetical protein QTP81_01020 [Alteromonas sp. ASW11-36]|uniref:Prokaryotic glutathione synthetase ATP-binding domain-containing protein n=1 Tax=Alteromonas arenosi TaxID=3055817 RepID=A0ABT7SUI5_9ALTE|nr:hypothetical protein [Alteromonas sp. ASW11-36]MDM7859184.1 hypothetical protein [Alteromonas sp. ASW11-36]
MPKVAILTMDSLEDFFAYDHMLDAPMRQAGWQTEHISWRDTTVDWDRFDVVIVRSPWDYQDDADAFLTCLSNIEQSEAILENPYSLMEWNVAKTYLRDLNKQGVPIVPTLWFEHYEHDMLERGLAKFKVDTLIVKPVVSANADHTYRIPSAQIDDYKGALQDVFAERALMIQPFLPSVLSPGEFSLFYFDHQYSHAILKTPKTDDFRVQEEHGGRLASVEPTAQMYAVAKQTLAALPQRALYARVDLIETDQGLAVMEVELIEPSLYFNMDDNSAQRFTDVFVQKYAHIK